MPSKYVRKKPAGSEPTNEQVQRAFELYFRLGGVGARDAMASAVQQGVKRQTIQRYARGASDAESAYAAYLARKPVGRPTSLPSNAEAAIARVALECWEADATMTTEGVLKLYWEALAAHLGVSKVSPTGPTHC